MATTAPKDPCRFDSIRIVPPDPDAANAHYGRETLASLRRQVEGKGYSALFFNLCFVDFRNRKLKDESMRKDLFEGMKSLIEQVRGFAREEKAKLIIGNALPVLKAGEHARRLRRKYNEWIREYAGRNPGIAVFDFFDILSNDNGRLHPCLSRNAFDPDLIKKAYSILEKELLSRFSDFQ